MDSTKRFTATFVSLFPDFFQQLSEISIVGRALKSGLVAVQCEQIRDHAHDKHKRVDDTPYGGGPGQLMRVDVVAEAIRCARAKSGAATDRQRVVLVDPKGPLFCSQSAQRLASYDEVIFVCGRYEGIDARILYYVDESVSVGDFILTGGELAAMLIFDATVRFVPGVLGNSESSQSESFAHNLLEHHQYTRPEEFEGRRVPDILLSGHHLNIAKAREAEQIAITSKIRPDLLKKK